MMSASILAGVVLAFCQVGGSRTSPGASDLDARAKQVRALYESSDKQAPEALRTLLVDVFQSSGFRVIKSWAVENRLKEGIGIPKEGLLFGALLPFPVAAKYHKGEVSVTAAGSVVPSAHMVLEGSEPEFTFKIVPVKAGTYDIQCRVFFSHGVAIVATWDPQLLGSATWTEELARRYEFSMLKLATALSREELIRMRRAVAGSCLQLRLADLVEELQAIGAKELDAMPRAPSKSPLETYEFSLLNAMFWDLWRERGKRPRTAWEKEYALKQVPVKFLWRFGTSVRRGTKAYWVPTKGFRVMVKGPGIPAFKALPNKRGATSYSYGEFLVSKPGVYRIRVESGTATYWRLVAIEARPAPKQTATSKAKP